MKNLIKKFVVISIIMLFAPQSAWSAQLTNLSVTPADLTTGVTTTYTIQFDAASAISNSPTRWIRFVSGSGGANLDNAVILSSSANITLNCTGCFTTSAFMTVTNSSVGPGDTVTFVLGNVINPVTPGLGNNYTVNVEDNSYSAVDTATIPGSVYINNSGPVVANQIPNQTIESQFGAQVIDLESGGGVSTDLNYTFTDGDGDPLSFSIVPGHDTNVVTAQVINDELLLTGGNTGSTSVTVEADDNDDGTITDTFNVTVYGSLGPASVTPGSTTAGDTTSYTFTFRAATLLNSGDFVIFNTPNGQQNQTNSNLVSLSGGSLTGSITSGGVNSTVIMFNGGSAGAGTTVTVVLDNIINPGSSGLDGGYEIRTTDGGSPTGIIDVSGTVFGSTSVPTVVNLIPNQSLNEEDGAAVVDLNAGAGVNTNLNYTFEDGDGHPLTFSIDAGHDTSVVTAEVINEELVLTGQGTGSTTITVRAADGIDGAVTDSFNVSVVGDLIPVTVLPSSLFAGEQESYTIVFSPATNLDSGDFVIFATPAGGPDQSNSTLQQLSGGTLTGSITSGGQNSTVVMFDGGSASPSDSITVVLGNIFNPVAVGAGPDYLVTTTDGGSVTGRSTVNGDTFIASDLIFENGFESMSGFISAVKSLLNAVAQSSAPQDNHKPVLNINFNRLEYHGFSLNLSNYQAQEKSLFDVLMWIEAVLISEQPFADFDGDGIANYEDELPLNL